MHRALSVFAFYLLLGHQLVSPRGGGGWWGRVQAEVSIIKRCFVITIAMILCINHLEGFPRSGRMGGYLVGITFI